MTASFTEKKSSLSNYTEGSLTGHFIRLMIPLIIGNILQQLYNTIDTLILGRFAGTADFAAVGLSSSVMNLLLFAIIGFCTGISVLYAQAYGAGDMRTFRSYHFHAFILGLTLIGGISAVVYASLSGILRLLQTPDELFSLCLTYLQIIVLGLIVSYFYNMYAALLRSIGKASVALYALCIAVLLNTALDYLFVAVYGDGIRGAAVATVIAQCFSVGFCVLYLQIREKSVWFSLRTVKWSSTDIRKMLRIGTVTSVHQMSLYLGKLFIQTTVNTAGTTMIAAYTATGRIEGFANSFGDSGYSATSILVAQNFGAGKRDRVESSFRISLVSLILLGIASSAVMYVLAPALSALLLGAESAALAQSVTYIRTISIFYIFCFTGNTFAGYFDGISLVRIPFIGALSHMTLRVILSAFWIPLMGLNGLAIATGIGWILVNIGWELVRLHMRRKKHDEDSLGRPSGNAVELLQKSPA